MYFVRKKDDMTEEPCLLCGKKTCLRVGQFTYVCSNCGESKRPKTWKRYTLKSKYSSMKSKDKSTAKHCISCLKNVDEDYHSLGQLKFCNICIGDNKCVCVVCISPNEYPHGECITTIKERAQCRQKLLSQNITEKGRSTEAFFKRQIER